ncbi:GNAT family N-acetyltransferase [Acidaminobacter sp. JC074]|uniref:GNAT family N-acetyltransferase n=1 Tax=Acidaminobacter sp. JC074 TaxID=2530199 RepID=UPI001F0F4F88|nr:GNAT family N-acetyltransferase [Acidaminobacter sp. JC074]
MILRKAKKYEVNLLNELAYDSEAIWGEERAYMEKFRAEYKLTEKMVDEDLVYVLEDKSIIGFFLVLLGEVPELELFYIEKSFIGDGYGKLLWHMMLDLLSEKSIKRFGLVASSDVRDFYLKLGAKEVERKASILKEGRMVYRLEYDF